jgi:transcriptional regulator with XRE-family HTH domain
MSESGEDLGARLRAARGRALTQRQLAEAAGVSVDLIRKLEQGIRKTAQIKSLARIAQAVDLDLGELIGKRASLPGVDLDVGVMALRRAVTPVDDLLGAEDQPFDEALDLTDLDGEITRAWGEYWSGRWAVLTAQLPNCCRTPVPPCTPRRRIGGRAPPSAWPGRTGALGSNRHRLAGDSPGTGHRQAGRGRATRRHAARFDQLAAARAGPLRRGPAACVWPRPARSSRRAPSRPRRSGSLAPPSPVPGTPASRWGASRARTISSMSLHSLPATRPPPQRRSHSRGRWPYRL